MVGTLISTFQHHTHHLPSHLPPIYAAGVGPGGRRLGAIPKQDNAYGLIDRPYPGDIWRSILMKMRPE